MKEECLICKAPLEYLNEDVLMECSICHTKGIDGVTGLCLKEESCNPIEIVRKMMDVRF